MSMSRRSRRIRKAAKRMKYSIRSRGKAAPDLGSDPNQIVRLEALEPRVLLSSTLTDGLLTIVGTADNDRITVRGVGDGEVVVHSNLDDDTDGEFTGVNAIVIEAGEGDDRVNIRGTLANSEGETIGVTIFGGDGNDRISGSKGDDTIDGGDGDDRIKGRQGNDAIDGGGGDDRIKGQQGDDTIDGGDGDDRISGNRGADRLEGGSGDDRVNGGQDDDLIIGGPGEDRMNGQGGEDTVSFETSEAGVDVSLARKRAEDDGFGGSDRRLKGFENLTGSPFDDTLEGSRKKNIIDGGDGTDTITDVGKDRGDEFVNEGPTGGGGGGGGGGGDPASLSVEEVSPTDGDEMVNLTRETIVHFDGEVDPTTVSTDSLFLIANGEAVEGRVTVSRTRRFATFFYDSPLPSSTEVRVVIDGDTIKGADGILLDGDGDGFAGGMGTVDFTTLPLTRIAGTNVFGFVRDSKTGDPIVGATIRVDAFPEADAVTDDDGRFELVDMPSPDFFVHVDGSTATNAPEGFTYPNVGKPFHSVPGETTQLKTPGGDVFDIFLPRMADGDFTALSDIEATVVGFGEGGKAELVELFPEIDPDQWDLFNITIEPGAAIADDGTPATEAAIIPVPPDRLPAPLPEDLNPALVISIQTPGATNFDVPAAITFPNLDGLEPGSKATIFSFNHDVGAFLPIGLGTVSEDGTVIVSDPGVGIPAPGWHFTSPPLNWTGGGEPEGNEPVDEETPPEIEVRLFTTSESDTLSFTFTPPPGEEDPVGEHEEPVPGETEPSRVVDITVDGIFWDEFYDNSGAEGLKTETITLRPGDAPVTRSATLRNLMDVLARGNGGKPFDRDVVYGAKITVEETLTLADGSRFKSSRIALPYLYVDQGDEAPEDTVLKFRPTIHAGSIFTGRNYDLRTAGAPLPDFIFEGGAAGDFDDTIVDGDIGIEFDAGGAGDRNAEMKVEVEVEGGTHQSTNSVSVMGKGMEPVTVYLDKANFKTVATTLTNMALRKTDAEAEAFYTSTKARIQALIDDVGGDANMAILLSDNASAPAGSTGRSVTVTWNFSDDEWVDANGDGRVQNGEVGDIDNDGTRLETPGDYADLNRNGMPDAGEFFGPMATDVNGDGMITAGDWIDLNGNGRFDRDSVLGRAFTGVDFNTTEFADKLVTNAAMFGKQQQAYIFDSVFEAAPAGSFEMFIDNTFDDPVGLTPAGQQPTKLGNVVTHETFHTLGEVHSDNMGIGGRDIMNHITTYQRNNTNTSRYVARTGSDVKVNVTQLVDTALAAYKTGYAARAMAPPAFPSVEAEALLAGASLLILDEGAGPFEDVEDPEEGVGPAFNLLNVDEPILGTFGFGGVINDGAGGEASTLTLTIENSGQEDLELTTISLADGGQGFSFTGLPDGTIVAPGATTTFDLTFDPEADGPLSDTISFATNMPSIVEGETVTVDIALNGQGLDPDPVFNIDVFADNNNFGGVTVGDELTVDLLTVTNTGAADLVFTPTVGGSLDYSIGGLEGVEQTLGTGESLLIPVSFTPTTTGLRPGAVEFDTNDPDDAEFDQSVVGTGIPDGPIEFDWGEDYIVVEYTGFTQRVVSNLVGDFMFGMPVKTQYEITVFDPDSGLVANGVGFTGNAGTFTDMTSALSFRASTANDSDGEGLPDDIENAIGSNQAKRDTNDDGVNDYQAIQLGLNPVGFSVPTGVVGNVDLRGTSEGVEVEGTEGGGLAAYVATGSHGLAIVNVSDFDSPIVQGQLDLPGTATDVAVDNDLKIAAVATGGSGVALVDVSDPMTPTVIDTIGVGASQIEAAGGFAFATSGTTLNVIDLVAAETVQTLILPGSGQVTDLSRKGSLIGAYISGSDTFALIDTTNPEESAVVGSTNIGVASSNVGVALGINEAWIAGSGLTTVDISDPASPALRHAPDSFFTARRFALNGSGVGLLTPDGGSVVEVYATSDPDSTADILASFPLSSSARDVTISGGLGFVATSNGLEIINFLAFDSAGEPPTVEITSPVEDNDPGTPGLQVIEGSNIPIVVEVTDDVQVRIVELLVDGMVVSNDVSFPFDFSAVALGEGEATSISLRARATDTGGNSTITDPFVVELVPDTFAPTIESITPSDGTTLFEGRRSVRVRFSEAIKDTAATTDVFSLTTLAGDPIPSTVELRDGNQLVQLLTDEPLPAGEYTFTIDATMVTDNSDNPLGAEDVTSSFTLIERPSVDDLFALRGEPVEGGIIIENSQMRIGINPDGSYINAGVGLNFADVEFLTPGDPLASYTIGFGSTVVDGVRSGGMNFRNSAPSGGSAIPVTIQDLSAGDFHGVRIEGVVDEKIMMERVIVFNEGELFVTVATQLTNLTEETLTNVAWLENMDPDQSTSIGIGSATNNDVVLEGTFVLGGALNEEFPAGLTVGLGTPDERATVSAESFTVTDPFTIIDSPEDPDGTRQDIAINLAFDYGDLGPLESVSSSLIMSVGRSIDESIANYLSAVGLTGEEIGGGGGEGEGGGGEGGGDAPA